jgi:hypothetical protein
MEQSTARTNTYFALRCRVKPYCVVIEMLSQLLYHYANGKSSENKDRDNTGRSGSPTRLLSPFRSPLAERRGRTRGTSAARFAAFLAYNNVNSR